MIEKLSLVLVFLIFPSDQPKLVKTRVTNDITVSLPKNWRPMDGLDFTERYPSVRAPVAAFTNEERVSDFSINVSATRWPDADLALAQKFFKASILNMFDRVEMIGEGIRKINGRNYIYFEFESRVQGNRMKEGLHDPVIRYSYQQYLVEPGRTLVFSFTCPRRERDQWQPVAHLIMNSLRVKG